LFCSGSPARCRLICLVTSLYPRSRMRATAPPMCGVMITPGELHSAWPWHPMRGASSAAISLRCSQCNIGWTHESALCDHLLVSMQEQVLHAHNVYIASQLHTAQDWRALSNARLGQQGMHVKEKHTPLRKTQSFSPESMNGAWSAGGSLRMRLRQRSGHPSYGCWRANQGTRSCAGALRPGGRTSGSGSGSVTSSAARTWPWCSASTSASVTTCAPLPQCAPQASLLQLPGPGHVHTCVYPRMQSMELQTCMHMDQLSASVGGARPTLHPCTTSCSTRAAGSRRSTPGCAAPSGGAGVARGARACRR
jgi:hypothetical protein